MVYKFILFALRLIEALTTFSPRLFSSVFPHSAQAAHFFLLLLFLKCTSLTRIWKKVKWNIWISINVSVQGLYFVPTDFKYAIKIIFIWFWVATYLFTNVFGFGPNNLLILSLWEVTKTLKKFSKTISLFLHLATIPQRWTKIYMSVYWKSILHLKLLVKRRWKCATKPSSFS